MDFIRCYCYVILIWGGYTASRAAWTHKAPGPNDTCILFNREVRFTRWTDIWTSGVGGVLTAVFTPILAAKAAYSALKIGGALWLFSKREFAKNLRVYYKVANDTVCGWDGEVWKKVHVGPDCATYYGLKSPKLSHYSTDVLRELISKDKIPSTGVDVYNHIYL